MKEEILRLIEESKKDYDIQSQRAELLLRSTKFKEELEEVTARQVNNFFGLRKNFHDSGKEFEFRDKHPGFEDSWCEWISFCGRWNIDSDWDGNSSSLKIFFTKPACVVALQSPVSEDAGLYIRIDPWTTKEHIHNIWPEIEEAQVKYFSKKVKKKSNFSRDLCWYDLNKIYGLSMRAIAELWEKQCPEQIDLLVINYIIENDKSTMKEIGNYIKKKGFKDLDDKKIKDNVLLKEIKEGNLKKFQENFDYNKEYYVEGKLAEKKLIPPFMGMIKEAIKRMAIFINNAKLTGRLDIADIYWAEFDSIEKDSIK